jgi:nucleoside-diphosphate-sugar epimerase
MRVLITGGSGFIGRHLVAALTARGDEVSNLDLPDHDVCNPYLEYRGFNRIYHLAAISSIGKSYEDPAETVRVNVGGTLNIVRKAKCHVVLASTINEGPSPYTVSKRAAELCMRTGDSILQIANVYGPGGHGVVDEFKATNVLTVQGGEQRKDFIHVDDVVQAFLNIKPGTTCVCSERLVSIHELACMFPTKMVQWCEPAPGEVSQRARKSDYSVTRKLEDYIG